MLTPSYAPLLWRLNLITLLVAVCAVILGHTLGDPPFDWTQTHISTYAARAPFDDFITAGMLLFAAFMYSLGLQLSLASHFKDFLWAHTASQLLGTSAAGMVFLATFEESLLISTPRWKASADVLTQQNFHDSGVLIFYGSAMLATSVAGVGLLFTGCRVEKVGGLVMLCCMPLVVVSRMIDFGALERLSKIKIAKGDAIGLRQRLMLGFLGLAAFILALLLRPRHSRHSRCDANLKSD
eukprot:gb/GFBE01004566.1/.p1 GENE.gb/GFBE01004566.1/~~gb/GFBE01004566.1/.p1  ORF type:complete len:239 (+),score=31.16 gb/GFBE01004566.1/:1-717(+)